MCIRDRIHPSYVELMKVVNNNVEIGEEPVVNSRYSIVIDVYKRQSQRGKMMTLISTM